MTNNFTNNLPSSVLEGIIERIVYYNEENAWSVVRLSVNGKRNKATAVGNLLGVQPGESVRLVGTWVVDKKYGEQFRVHTCSTKQPSTLVGMEKYLASGLIRGVGKEIASRLVKHFGLNTFLVVENHPEQLTEVEGIGPVRSCQIRNAYWEQRQIKEVMVFLQSYGISTTYAVKIYKQYKGQAIAIVKDNPYQLAIDIFGIGFKTADKIAMSIGISHTSPKRAQAGVLYVLGQLSSKGHVFCPAHELVNQAALILEIDTKIIEHAIVDLANIDLIVIESIGNTNAVYLKSLYASEKGGAECLDRILSTSALPITIDSEHAISWFENAQHIHFATAQRNAILKALTNKVLVITGGPGTGKTTIVNGIIRILEKKKRRILLCAPTGRAAKRIMETSGRQAKTIHRLLEFDPHTQRFARNLHHPLEADVIVVDEMSMVDTVLFYNLVKAIPSHCQLILVGDVDQLPSVGPGQVLRDLICSGMVCVVILREIFRQARKSLIVTNAHRVNHGEIPAYACKDKSCEQKDFYFIERDTPEEVFSTLKKLISTSIPQRFRFDPIDDVQVLTPMHKGLLGTINLNAELQDILNPYREESISRGASFFRVGDKVMQIRNNYTLEVFNGDIGRVVSVDSHEKEIKVCIDGKTIKYDSTDLDDLTLAYVCSIHKSQGNEYPAVIVLLHTQHYAMLQRNLLYTAITRGRQLVVLLGSRKALAISVKNNRVQSRYTHFAQRLRNAKVST